MTVLELLARARSQVGCRTVYRLGGGLIVPKGESVQDAHRSADCSAYVCWVLGLEKYQPGWAFLRRLNGGWYNTTGIWADARYGAGWFSADVEPQPGAVIVYPAASAVGKPGPRIGHVGIVTDVRAGKVTKVLHCSSGAYRSTGDAIRETGPEVFDRVPYTMLAWCERIDAVETTRGLAAPRSALE